MVNRIGIGIIGLGHIGRYHIRALERFTEFQPIAACDRDPRCRSLVSPGMVFYDDPDTLLGDDRIDTVIIATPNDTHFLLGMKAFEAGKNVILEKPATSSLDQFERLDGLFGAGRDIHIYYAFHAAKSLEVTHFREYYQKQTNRDLLGQITSFACHFYDPYVEGGEIKPEARALDNCWIDSGVNALSVLSEFMDLGGYRTRSVTKTYDRTRRVPVQALVQYQFPAGGSTAGGVGWIHTSWALGVNQKVTWLGFGQSGYQIRLDHTGQKIVQTGADTNEEVLKDYSSQGDRLFNHYLGVFGDYLHCRKSGRFNAGQAAVVHHLLYRGDRE
jgi:predicted dehydrogenase